MTTSVTVKHNGPDHNDIMVQVIDPTTNTVVRETRRKMGEELNVYLWDSQGIKVVEVEKIK